MHVVASKKTSLALAYIGVWFAVIAWGLSFVAARILLHAETAREVALSPIILAALRFSIASLFFILPLSLALIRGQLTLRQVAQMVLLGQIAFSCYFWLQYTGVQKTNASISSILVVGLIPTVTAFISRFLNKERFSLFTFAALLLGFLGVSIIVWQKPVQFISSSDFLLGAICLVGNAFAFAAYSNLSKRWMQNISPLVMTGGTMLSGALGLIVLSVFDPQSNRWSDVLRLDTIQWLALLFLAIGCSVIAYFVYNVALTRLDASRVAVYIYFEPVVAILFGVTLLGESVNWQTVGGIVAIALSIVAVSLSKREKKAML